MNGENNATLPPQPGTCGSSSATGGDKIIVEIMGQEFQLDPIQALSLAGTVMATLEVYFRNRN